MSYIKLGEQRRLWFNSQEQKKMFLAGLNTWTRPPGIVDFYGVTQDTIPLDLQLSKSEFASGDFVRLSNQGGASPLFAMHSNSPEKFTINSMGGAVLNPKNAFSISNRPDMMNTRVFICVDIKSLNKDQYFMGATSPQSNVYLNAAGTSIIVNRRNPDTNLVETTSLNLLSPVTTGMKLYEIDFALSGTLELYINGVLQSTASHTFPQFILTQIASGQAPWNGWGLHADLYRVCSLIKGGSNFQSTVDTLRGILSYKYGIEIQNA